MNETLRIMPPEERVRFALRSLYERYDYRPYRMSQFEEYSLYAENRSFLQSPRVITFTDLDGRMMALKPDVTLSIIKNAPETPGAVRKVHYRENVYRMDRDSGNFKEILQAGLECVGDLSGYEIAEVVYLAAKSLEALGEQTILSLSHVGLIRYALDKSGIPASARKQALDCLRQKREQELRALCESCGADPELPIALLRARELSELEPMLGDSVESWRELRQIVQLLKGRVALDFSLGNDMKYYSGLVFKGYVQGIPSHILSGGQYDRLLGHMGKKARAIGFAVYLNQLEAEEEDFDADTLLLTGDASPAEILAAAESIPGRVLAVKSAPADKTWKRTALIENGEVRYLD